VIAEPAQKAGPIGPGSGVLLTEFTLDSVFGTNESPRKKMERAWKLSKEVPWIRAAEDVIASRFAGVDWHLEDENDEEITQATENADAKAALDLMEFPQRDPSLGAPYTRTSLWSLVSRTMGPCGSAFVLMDRREAFAGTPAILQPIAPWRFTAQEDQAGNLIGWWIDKTQTNPGIAVRTDELIHFALERDYRGHFGVGLVESALLKLRNTQGLDQHLGMVISAGGRLSGIMSPEQGLIEPETMLQMERDWRTVVEQQDAAKRLQLVRAPVKFTPTTLTPHELMLKDMMNATRDDLLALWGVPFRMIGGQAPTGLNSGEAAKQDEANLWQGPVHSRLLVFKEGIQYQMLDLWARRGAIIEFEVEEPEFDDDSPRYDLLGKSLNTPLRNAERRAIINLPPLGDPLLDNEILLPATMVPYASAPDEEAGTVLTAMPPEPALLGSGTPQSLAAGETSDNEEQKAALDLDQDEIDEEIALYDEEDDWGEDFEGKAKAPKFIFGRLNPAYQSTATSKDVSAEKESIRKRAIAKYGKEPSQAAIDATYKRNLERKQRQGIHSRAKRKFGRTASEAAVTATLRRNRTRDSRLNALFEGKARMDPLRASLTKLRANLDRTMTPQIRKRVANVLDRQKAEIAERIRKHSAAIERNPKDQSVWWNQDKWDREMAAALRGSLEGMAQTVSTHIGETLPAQKAEPMSAVERVLERGAARVTEINETTRDAVQRAILTSIEAGHTANEAADAVSEAATFDSYRSELIARTELMDAYNTAAISSYQDAGIKEVQAVDGDKDEECAARDGRIFPADEAFDISDHPNGTLDWIPVINYTELREAFNG
jgi:hypothetical protein